MVLKQDCKALKALIEATKYDKNRQGKTRKQPFRGGNKLIIIINKSLLGTDFRELFHPIRIIGILVIDKGQRYKYNFVVTI